MGLSAVDEAACCASSEDEVLPFALNENDHANFSSIQPLHAGARFAAEACGTSMMSVSLSSYNHNDQNNYHQPPGLVSSLMSCQSDGTSSVMSDFPPTNHSQVEVDSWAAASMLRDNMLSSHHLDAAASLMAGMEGSLAMFQPMKQGMHQPMPRHQFAHDRRLHPQTPFSSLPFSLLMDNARGEATRQEYRDGTLPVLPEEATLTADSGLDSFHSAHPYSSPTSSAFPSNIDTTTSHTIPSPSDWIPINVGSYQPPALEESYSSDQGGQIIVAGGSSRRRLLPSMLDNRRTVSATKLDATSFKVSMTMDQPNLSVDDVMEIVGNPSYLVLWFESIRSLVITRSSEGARNAENRTSSSLSSDQQRMRAEYEGEWIEGTTTDLISPPSPSSCLYSTSKAMWNYVGFPTNYGTVSMFVERQRGRVGLTVGPFAGDVTVSHTLTVVKDAQSAIRIVDRVALSREGNTELICGMLDCFGSCLLPTLNAYMDQVESSMIRLRTLVQTAEACCSSDQFEDFELVL
jgi:hypothetical protein